MLVHVCLLWPILCSLNLISVILLSCAKKSRTPQRKPRQEHDKDDKDSDQSASESRSKSKSPSRHKSKEPGEQKRKKAPKPKKKKSPKEGVGEKSNMKRPRNKVRPEDIEDTDKIPETGNTRDSTFGQTTGTVEGDKKIYPQPLYRDDHGSADKVKQIKDGAMAERDNPDYKTLKDNLNMTSPSQSQSTGQIV